MQYNNLEVSRTLKYGDFIVWQIYVYIFIQSIMIITMLILYLIYPRDFWRVSVNWCPHVFVYKCTHCMPPDGTRWGAAWVRICRKYFKKGLFSFVCQGRKTMQRTQEVKWSCSFFRLSYIYCENVAKYFALWEEMKLLQDSHRDVIASDRLH